MTAQQAAERQAAQDNLVHELSEALSGCIEHCKWSTPQGQQAFQSALDALAKVKS
ncbi:hypothetical protein MNJPNG_04800 [Cupriavidus oxalaticus]|uniref:hypothetical protein n=1 Tax=Cupriavidus oxalaticus TaxID=96344 RepID=UPI003F74001C